MAKRGTANKNK